MTTPPMGDFSSEKGWPEGAIEDWQHGASYGWIENKYGRAYSTVAKSIRFAKMAGTKRLVDITTRKRKGGRPALNEQRPITSGHLSVGMQLTRFREVDNVYTHQDVADIIKVNRLTVRKMELGLYDFTVEELKRIAIALKTSVEELMQPFT